VNTSPLLAHTARRCIRAGSERGPVLLAGSSSDLARRQKS